MRIAAVIPAYQAASTVAPVIRGTLEILPDLLVIDDGSSDGTADVARAAGAEVHRLPVNSGKGTALGTAFQILMNRGFDGIVTLDADGQHIPAEIPRLLAMAADADLVLGTRDHLFAEMSPLRRRANALSSRGISWIAGLDLDDVQTGFRYYSRVLIERLGPMRGRFEAESAVVVRAGRAGLRVRTTPVHLARADGRSTSHFRPLIDGVRIVAAVAAARLGAADAPMMQGDGDAA
ncbi:MAG: glycosyltransferase family 2 protein [Acidobacteria bacterium]|nr:glycosyltransferase family 2 protein [Acidobacteriota bacterium]